MYDEYNKPQPLTVDAFLIRDGLYVCVHVLIHFHMEQAMRSSTSVSES